jgi:hypothetical protein
VNDWTLWRSGATVQAKEGAVDSIRAENVEEPATLEKERQRNGKCISKDACVH